MVHGDSTADKPNKKIRAESKEIPAIGCELSNAIACPISCIGSPSEEWLKNHESVGQSYITGAQHKGAFGSNKMSIQFARFCFCMSISEALTRGGSDGRRAKPSDRIACRSSESGIALGSVQRIVESNIATPTKTVWTLETQMRRGISMISIIVHQRTPS